MKKAIIVLSVIAIIVSIFFTAISLSTAASHYANYTQSASAEVSVSAEGYMKTRAGILIAETAVTVIFCLYMILLTYRLRSYIPDIVLSAVCFAVGPVLTTVVDAVMTRLVSAMCSITDYAAYNAYLSGINGFALRFHYAELLLAFAVAFSIAEKCIRKKQAA